MTSTSTSTSVALNPPQALLRTIKFASNEWTNDPGASAAPLVPPGDGVIKTLPATDLSVYGALPPMPGDIKRLNRTYLETTTTLSANKEAFVFGTLLGVPLLFGLTGFAIWMFSQDFSMQWLAAYCLLMLSLGWVMQYAAFRMAFFTFEDTPIRFSRRDAKVYRFRPKHWRFMGMDVPKAGAPDIQVYDWAQCRAEIVRKVVSTGKTLRRDCFLYLAVLDPATGKVVDRFPVGDRDVFSEFSGRVWLWESIRRFMQEGDERIPEVTPHPLRGTLLDCIESHNPLILPSRAGPGVVPRALGVLLACLLVPFSLLWWILAIGKWLSVKSSKKVDWGELEQTVFTLDPEDPALKKPQTIEELAAMHPEEWAKEVRKRKRYALAWAVATFLPYLLVAWFAHLPPFEENHFYTCPPVGEVGQCRKVYIE